MKCKIFFPANAFENIVCRILAILLWSQYVVNVSAEPKLTYCK